MSYLSVVAGWSVIIILDVLALIVLFLMMLGRIDLSRLLSEPTGHASLSRFQFLVFTYVVGLTLFFVTVNRSVPEFPDIPGGLLSLLGISASTYAVSKGIQFSTPEGRAADTQTIRTETKATEVEEQKVIESKTPPPKS